MSTPLLSEVLAAVAEDVKPVLRCTPYPIFNPSPPCAYLQVTGGADLTMHKGVGQYFTELYACVAALTDRAAYAKFAGMMDAEGDKSIRAAIHADTASWRDLAGVDVACTAFRSFNLDEVAALEVFGSIYQLDITITREH